MLRNLQKQVITSYLDIQFVQKSHSGVGGVEGLDQPTIVKSALYLPSNVSVQYLEGT